MVSQVVTIYTGLWNEIKQSSKSPATETVEKILAQKGIIEPCKDAIHEKIEKNSLTSKRFSYQKLKQIQDLLTEFHNKILFHNQFRSKIETALYDTERMKMVGDLNHVGYLFEKERLFREKSLDNLFRFKDKDKVINLIYKDSNFTEIFNEYFETRQWYPQFNENHLKEFKLHLIEKALEEGGIDKPLKDIKIIQNLQPLIKNEKTFAKLQSKTFVQIIEGQRNIPKIKKMIEKILTVVASVFAAAAFTALFFAPPGFDLLLFFGFFLAAGGLFIIARKSEKIFDAVHGRLISR